MGFFDNAQDMLGRGASAAQGVLDKGVSVAKGAVSGVAVEQQPFMKGFVRLCADGSALGWHQGCDGALTAVMDDAQAASCRAFFYDNPSSWVGIGLQEPSLAGSFIATTALAVPMRNVALDTARCVGIVEINASGDAWRIVWGLKDGGVPTASFPQHFAAHAQHRIVHSCAPARLAAARLVLPQDGAALTAALWGVLPQAMAVAGRGVAAVGGPAPAAGDVAAALSGRDAAVFPDGGLVVAAASPDDAFAIAQALDKAADVYLAARAANADSDRFASALSSDELKAWARARGVGIDESVLG